MHVAVLSLLAASPLWGTLEPGPYRAAYRIVTVEDASRLDGPKRGPYADPAGARPRRITVHLWYPAPVDTPGDGLTLGEYSAYNRLRRPDSTGLRSNCRDGRRYRVPIAPGCSARSVIPALKSRSS